MKAIDVCRHRCVSVEKIEVNKCEKWAVGCGRQK